MALPEQVPGEERSQFALLKTRRFLPFFLTQFLGAFNDNLFRNALVISVTYGASAAAASGNAGLLANLAQGLFILPFFLFSALAGQLADKYEKSRLIRQTRLAEVVLMFGAAAALYFGDVPTLLWLVFMMGVLATIFGPLKYSLMPQHLRHSELVGGNALVDAGTFIAILIGTISGGLLAPTTAAERAAGGTSDAHVAAAITMVVVAIGTYLCSRAIPRAEATDPGLRINFNPFTATWQAIRFAAQTRAIFLSLLGISWFWLVGALILAQLPSYAHDVLGGDKTVYILLLTAFSVGTALGSLACERLSGHKVEIGLVPLGSIGLTVFVLDLYFAHPAAHTGGAALLTWKEFVSTDGWRVVMDCAFIGIFGGLFIVPLYALILQRSVESHRARVIAANNILNAGFMVLAALLAIVWLKFFSIPQLFILAAVLNALVAIYIYSLVPEFLMRFLSWVFVNVMYRIKVKGLEHIPETGPALIVSNHVSFMDALVIGGSVRRPVRFVMDHNIFKIPVMGFIFRTARAIPIAPAREDPAALQKAFDRIDAELADGEVVCIFPEGKLTRDGEMNEFKKGVEKILERRPVPVIPMALRGLWGSFFSHREGKPAMTQPPKRFWSRIEVVVTAPVPGDDASATSLQRIVAGLRGEWQ